MCDRFRTLVVRGAVPLMVLLAGCNSSSEPETRQPAVADKQPGEQTKAGSQQSGPITAKPEQTAKPDPAALWKDLAAKANKHLEAAELDDAKARIDELKKVYSDPDQPGEQQQAELADLEQRVTARMAAMAAERREVKLADAARQMDAGQLDAAIEALDWVLAHVPSDEQRQQATQLKDEIERRRGARRKLATWMKLLGSEKRAEVRAAQNELYREPEVALPMLLEALQDKQNPQLVANSMELLRRMRRPDVTLSAMVAVLGRVDQKSSWDAAVAEISQSASPGAGPLLLELLQSSKDPQQRAAALRGLAAVVDPPPTAFLALLPLLFADGPELAPALEAAYNAVRVHRQYDLVSRRGLPAELSPQQEQQLLKLPERLAAIADAGEKAQGEGAENLAAAARAARVLAVASRQVAAGPFPNVKVLNAVAEYPEGPAAAVLDGVWNSVDLNTMWYHPIEQKSTIVLDLGEERTVTGVRLWNFNQPGGQTRGWKEVDVYVSKTPSSIEPVATGIVPMAPGVADPPDYSTLVPVPFVRGRYVKLTARSVWSPNAYTGLAELQIEGF